MPDNPYAPLVEKLNQFPTKAPDTPELREILKLLFTEEEARFAVGLNLQPLREPAEEISRRTGMTVERIEEMGEEMARKGLVYSAPRHGKKCYALLPLVPGIFELQFMKAGTSAKDKKLAELFDKYYFSGWGKEGWSFKIPFARAIPVQETIPADTAVHTYDEVKTLIQNSDKFALTNCYCRHEHELIDKGCGRPKEVCMLFGPFVDFAVERGFAWKTSREDMLAALEKAEEAGLVHLSDNIQEKINFICNCCGCCCGILGTITKLNIDGGVAKSSFVLDVDWEKCVNCGACAKRCQVSALATAGKGKELQLKFDESRCIGCGICVRACKKQHALSMTRRENPQVPQRSFMELGMAMMGIKTGD